MTFGIGSFKIVGVGLACIASGAMLGELLDHAIHGRLNWFAQRHTLQIALTFPLTVATIYFLWSRIQLARAESARPVEQREKAGVGHGFTGITFQTTPFIRATAYSAFYLLGILINFIP